MESIVVDSSVVVKWLLVEPYSTEARRIPPEYQKGAVRLLAEAIARATRSRRARQGW
jgi:predicted nucleic acid-binding protein